MAREITIHVVDDEFHVRESVQMLLEVGGFTVHAYEAARDFLDAEVDDASSCVLTDIRMPEMDGLALQRELTKRNRQIPVIIMTGHGDIPMAVQAMKQGAVDFLEKPFEKASLLRSIEVAGQKLRQPKAADAPEPEDKRKKLTEREIEVMDLLVAGNPNKIVAHKLSISPRTVEVHRARIMEKLGAKSLADLVRMSLT